MTLGAFQPKARIQGDRLDLKAYNGRPLLVRVTEYVPDFSSQAYPNPKPVIFADVVDLYTSQIFVNCLFGAGAVVDNLKEFAGTETVMPVKPVLKNSPKSGRTYIALEALDGQEAANADQWYNAYWGHVNQTRAQREAAAAPAQVPGAPQGFAPPGTPPGAGVNAAPAQFGGAPMQQQQQAPAQNFQQPQGVPGAPATAPPANPAYAPQGNPQFGAPVQGQVGQFPAQGQAPQGYGPPQGGPNGMVPGTPGAPVNAPQGFGAPQGQAPAQQAPIGAGGYGQYAPPAGAPGQDAGLFTNQPPAPQPGQGFGAPVGDQAAANAALAHLNAQVQPQG